MGKRIIAQARGHGGTRYRAPSHRYAGKVEFHSAKKIEGIVKDIFHDPGRNAPVMLVRFEDGKELLHIAPEGIMVGQKIKYDGEIAIGNVVELRKIPEGTKICCLENRPGSGPKLLRSAGSYGVVVGKSEKKVTVLLPGNRTIELDGRCRAMIGVPAASGMKDKPWVKAGKKWHAMHARGKLYPRTSAVKMNPVDHPFGGKSKRPRQKDIASWKKPPGAKVGRIGPKRKKKK
ncbi:MAG: 50S ribosomal protein L2 [Candidatus Aenigmarchaeota archaeon ex4484_224]|nr:MAG: 50S ribosomal protein L2 [Candidatus Aenigmarchaeota archaeon ex4484_224]